ncbi:MAG: hypothetical protein NT079_06925, partial [Candidatus Omnitrophica bacterium]|nr:hypothetical protein [Candidatus Omnitrophota bacterium]
MTMMTVGIGVAVFVLIGVSAVWWAIFAETEEQEEEITLRNDREEDRMALEQALRAEGSAREELRTLRNELVSSRASHEATKKEAD